MKRTQKAIKSVAILLLLSSLSSYAIEITEQDRANKIPSITHEEMVALSQHKGNNSIINQTYYDEVIVPYSYKEEYILGNLAKKLQKNYNTTHSNKIYVLTQNDNQKVFLSQGQKAELNRSRNVDKFINELNKYSNMSFFYNRIHKHSGYDIIYIKTLQSSNMNVMPKIHYTLLEPTKRFFNNHNDIKLKCSEFERAFEYFRTHHTQTDKTFHFNLSAIEVMSLYIKLARWNVDLDAVNESLLKLFAKKAQYINNFNFNKAFEDLRLNPSYTTAFEIKTNLQNLESHYANDKPRKTSGTYCYEEERKLSDILKSISSVATSNYVLNEKYGKDIIIPLPADRIVTVKNIQDFNDYLIKNTPYKLIITKNKYIKSATKEVVIVMQRSKKNQFVHYINEAIKVTEKFQNQDFSKEALIDDLKRLTKGDL